MDSINTEMLISLVKQRPGLWDKTSEEYKDAYYKAAAWQEICHILGEDYDDSIEKDKQLFNKLVVKKWTYTRDSYVKSLKRLKGKKSSNSGKGARTYVYSKQMGFLNKIVNPDLNPDTEIQSQLVKCELTDDDEISKRLDITHTIGPKQETIMEFQQIKETPSVQNESNISDSGPETLDNTPFVNQQTNSMHNSMQNEYQENRHLSFFKSILPSLVSLNDDQILNFQSGVISVLQNVKRKKTI